ncbi:hypothetical protein [Mycoplasmopsis gallinacea]|uniref:Uncharacterized protein n=1 Tax=Mycoplasmopsis gallinacea TaxID=29556 RepID=A0A6H0V0Z0_9BACT|nr:hypothetical protein [Mycoplasmopsis gallinacea]QIW62010.1 hypothetical protein GOQ20_00815 [Mycoplasmopsis gallinacea]
MIKREKLNWKTRFRYFWLGKRPRERKSLPKIVEYLYMIFANIILLIFTILVIWEIFAFKSSENKSLAENFNLYGWRILISLASFGYVTIILCSIHIFYILSKTEFYKWSGILGVVFSLLGLSPIALFFLMVSYSKNEIAFY